MKAPFVRKALALLALAPAVVAAQPNRAALQQYQLDAGHSIFEFAIRFAFTHVKGRFTDPKGSIIYDSAHPEQSSVTVIAPSKSLDTGWRNRDRHLKTSDFFDVEKYPTVMFQSTRLRRNGADWLMDGNLTMHGVTRAMTVPLVMPAPRRSPESGWMILSATSSFKLARRDFGITGGDRYNNWFNAARQAAMADTVDISLEVEGWWADAASQRAPMLPALQRVKTLGVQAQIDTVKRRLSAVPDSVLMDSFTGADLLVRELLEEDPAKAVQLASAWPALFKGSRAYAVYAHALAVTGDSLGAAKQYAEARRLFKRKTPDPDEKFPQDDPEWYWLDNLVRTSLERGHIAAARGLARYAAEMFPEIARARATYGWTLVLTGDTRAAADQFAHALEADPNDTRTIEFRRRLPQ
ncbi:MAG TPA: YceI family protein [Gemmatimonadales bacterium]|nr:YceI family protein [Gemmatimonadales bacterium]